MRTLELLKVVVVLVCAAGMMRAYRRGQNHIAARFAATTALTLTAGWVYRAYHGISSPAIASALAVFVVTMSLVAVAKGRFHAPPH